MRARNIKPGFFRSVQLLSCDPLARILFAGLWCAADRAGRLLDRPMQLKIDLLPGDACDADALLEQLAAQGLIVRYRRGAGRYIQVVEFAKHQNPHQKEAPSTIPAQEESAAGTVPNVDPAPVESVQEPVAAGMDDSKAPDKPGAGTVQAEEIPERARLIPDSLIPDPREKPKQQGGSPPGDPPPLTLTDPSESGDPPSKADPIPYAAIVAAYNRTMTRLPKAVEINGKRRTLIRSAWHEGRHRQSVEFWIAHFEECEDDPFLNGTGPYAPPHENWRPSFDFLMSAKTITRVYERALQRMERAA